MSIASGSFRLGPDSATLTVRTGTAGAMAKAGHSLEIRVGAWSAELVLSEDPGGRSLALDADSSSLQVTDGVGGPKALTDDDRGKIAKTINDKVLRGTQIRFRSAEIEEKHDGALSVRGELELMGRTSPVDFDLRIDGEGQFSATAEVVQTRFGMEPYSAMMGALKVKDELTIEVAGQLPR